MKEALIERSRRTVGERGRMRLPADQWRDMDAPGEVVCDYVELDDGTREFRLRQVTDE